MHSKSTPKGDGARSTQQPNTNHSRNPASESSISSTATTKWKADQIAVTKSPDVGNPPTTPLTQIMPSFTGEGKLRIDDKSGIGGIGGWYVPSLS